MNFFDIVCKSKNIKRIKFKRWLSNLLMSDFSFLSFLLHRFHLTLYEIKAFWGFDQHES
jgi:hypothetical protein